MSRKTASGRVLREMDPNDIYFTHARIRPVFTGCNKRINETLDEILAGTTTLDDIPYITVIENFEAAPTDGDDEDEDGPGRKKRGKGSKRGGGGASAAQPPTPYYFSLNNRRLFLFKTLKDMGRLDKVTVQVKPALERERTKYTRDRCVLRAKLMGPSAADAAQSDGVETPPGDSDGRSAP